MKKAIRNAPMKRLKKNNFFESYRLHMSFQELDTKELLEKHYVTERGSYELDSSYKGWMEKEKTTDKKSFLPPVNLRNDLINTGKRIYKSRLKGLVDDPTELDILEVVLSGAESKENSSRTVYLTGKIGVGKSTLIRHLVERVGPKLPSILSDGAKNPLFIPVELKSYSTGLDNDRLLNIIAN